MCVCVCDIYIARERERGRVMECRRMLLDRAKAGWGEVRGLRGAFEIQAREGGGWVRRSLCCCGEY